MLLASRASAPSPDSQSSSRTTATGYRSVPYSVLPECHNRLKAAWWATRGEPDGAPTLSALVERIFVRWCEQLEKTHNDGHPFPPAPERPRGQRSAGAPARRSRAYYLPDVLHERLKATWWATRSLPDSKPLLSEVVEQQFLSEAVELEQRHNDGSPFPPAPARARGMSAAGLQRQADTQRQLWQSRRDEQAQEER